MNFKNIIKKYSHYKTLYRQKNKLCNLFYKRHSFNISYFKGILGIFSIFCLSFIFGSLFKSFFVFISIISAFLFYSLFYQFKEEKFLENEISSFLVKRLIRFHLDFNKNKLKETDQLINKYINQDNIKEFDDLVNIQFSLREIKEKEFIDNHKKSLQYTLFRFININTIEEKAKSYSIMQKYDFYDYIHYVFKNISVKDLRSLSKEEISFVLNDFNTEQKLELSKIIKNKLEEETNKENEIEKNLESIDSLINKKDNKISNIINRN